MPKKNGDKGTVVCLNRKRAPQLQRPRRKSWTKKRRGSFLTELAATANVTAAARAAGMCPQSAYNLRNRDAGFYKAWIGALTEGYERLEMLLLERAMHGLEEDVWYRGEVVGSKRRHSDAVALTLYRAHRETVKRWAPPTKSDDIRERLTAKFAAMKQRLSDDD